jgi:hypothetical protein
MERIIASVPGFRTGWDQFLNEWKTEEPLPYYLGMSELAHYVVENYSRGITTEFPALFSVIELLLQDPAPELESLITVGFLEDVQNIASHREFGANAFRRWLGTRSVVVWDEIDAHARRMDAWTGKRKPRWWQFSRRRKTFDSEKALSQVENPELKKIIESMYRKK